MRRNLNCMQLPFSEKKVYKNLRRDRPDNSVIKQPYSKNT